MIHDKDNPVEEPQRSPKNAETSSNEPQNRDSVKIVYKKENVWKKSLIWGLISGTVIVVSLFLTGFFMGLAGQRPPTIDVSNLLKRIEQRTGVNLPGVSQNNATPTPNTEPNPATTTNPSSSPTSIPSPTKKTASPSPNATVADDNAAEEQGKQAGKLYKASKNFSESFWKGFNSEVLPQ